MSGRKRESASRVGGSEKARRYAALILDRRLAGPDEVALGAGLPRVSLLISSHLYSFLVVGSLLSAAAKELLV